MRLLSMSAVLALAMATDAAPKMPTPNWTKTCQNRITVSDDFRNAKGLNASLWKVENMDIGHLKFSDKGVELHTDKVGGSVTLATIPLFTSGIFTIRMMGSAAPGYVSSAVIRPEAAAMDGKDEIDVEITGKEPNVMQMVAWTADTASTTPKAKYAMFGNNTAVKMHKGNDLTTNMTTFTVSWDGNAINWYRGDVLVFNGAVTKPGSMTMDKALKLGAWYTNNSWAGIVDSTKYPDPFQTIESISIDGCLTGNWTASSDISSTIEVNPEGTITKQDVVEHSTKAATTGSASGAFGYMTMAWPSALAVVSAGLAML